MPKTRTAYLVAGADLYHVRNRNEKRVARCLEKSIDRLQLKELSAEAIADIYALALNMLPSRYAQTGTIVLRDPVSNENVETAVAAALERVLQNPKS